MCVFNILLSLKAILAKYASINPAVKIATAQQATPKFTSPINCKFTKLTTPQFNANIDGTTSNNKAKKK
ncbi:MAG: hypothetical protein LBH74_06370 [Nitrososphaerota archaeon]|uniref:hypothetical protein n=1 Tax=Candidatus Bathycorpusculum sp. TaxID=2994959 RepID=UPI002839BEF3|nr:hypothetical protein [Candidatus Termitimicrobium sp.]MCL2432710.1 hypothetical protein [Candidatus Termitimicrobium sp.]MDR0493242.1 hypothetical protein [Nitrososphaerota archaeon]